MECKAKETDERHARQAFKRLCGVYHKPTWEPLFPFDVMWPLYAKVSRLEDVPKDRISVRFAKLLSELRMEEYRARMIEPEN